MPVLGKNGLVKKAKPQGSGSHSNIDILKNEIKEESKVCNVQKEAKAGTNKVRKYIKF